MWWNGRLMSSKSSKSSGVAGRGRVVQEQNSAVGGRSGVSSDAMPVFVLGMARNGTTWLGNLLASHEEISASRHHLHHGVHESNVLWNKRHWRRLFGSFRNLDSYISFLHLYASEDYFRLAEGDLGHHLRLRCEDFYDFFFDLMDELARKSGKKLWSTKLDPLFYLYDGERDEFLRRCAERYGAPGGSASGEETYEVADRPSGGRGSGGPQFVAIKRELYSYLASYLHMEGASFSIRRKGPAKYFSLLLGVARYINNYRRIERVIADYGGLLIRYEELLEQHDETVEKIADYLGVDPQCFDEISFSPNTSFASRGTRSLGSFERFVAGAAYGIGSALPFLSRWFLLMYQWLKPQRSPLFHRLIKSEFFPEELKEELRRKGADRLAAQLEENGSDAEETR